MNTGQDTIPYVGRVVHYRTPKSCAAAMVVDVLGATGNVDLQVFTTHGHMAQYGIAYDDDRTIGTWHYPNARCTAELMDADPSSLVASTPGPTPEGTS